MALTSRALAVLPVIAIAAPAHGEGERALSLSAGYATFSTPGKKVGNMEPPALSPDFGLTLSGVYERSLGSDFELRGELAGAYFHGGEIMDQSPSSYVALIDAGFVFRFDVLKDVPYAFGGLGVMTSGGGPIDRGAQGVFVIGGGLDILTSREHSWGAEVRLGFDFTLPGKGDSGGASNVALVTLALRHTIRWGFF